MTARGRLAVLLAALLLAAGVTAIRVGASPQGAGFRHGIAAAPDGGAYVADPGRGRLVAVDSAGHVEDRGRLPAGIPVALASDGARFLVFVTDHGAASSVDAGLTWRSVPAPAGRYTAAWVSGRTALVGRWAGHLYRTDDAGGTWAEVPETGNWQVIAAAGADVWAATLTGVIRSADGGRTWTATGLPSRVTALTAGPGGLLAARWDGTTLILADGRPPSAGPRYPAGVWALAGGLAATVSGLADATGPRPGLGRREVTALVASGSTLYAGLASGPVVESTDGGATWRTVVEG